MLFPPKVELGKATKANVRNCRLLTNRDTTHVGIRGFFFRDKNQLETILKMFIPSEDFWSKPYHKYDPITFDW